MQRLLKIKLSILEISLRWRGITSGQAVGIVVEEVKSRKNPYCGGNLSVCAKKSFDSGNKVH